MPLVSKEVGRSNRILIRQIELSDMPALKKTLMDSMDWLKPWMPAPMVNPNNDDLIHRSIQKAKEEWDLDLAYRPGVFVGEELVGRVSITISSRGNFQCGYCGYWVGKAYAGLAYAPEALCLLLEFAFGPCELHRIQFAVMPENAPSLKVMEKLGIREEGYCKRYMQIGGAWRDHKIFGVTIEDWADMATPLYDKFVSR